jgi:hypothetical protein
VAANSKLSQTPAASAAAARSGASADELHDSEHVGNRPAVGSTCHAMTCGVQHEQRGVGLAAGVDEQDDIAGGLADSEIAFLTHVVVTA